MSTVLQLPRLHRPPVVLRAFTAADAPLIAEASTDPLIPLITTVPALPDPTSVQAFIERQLERATSGKGYAFAIADASTDAGLGQIGLWPLGDERASVGYWVAPSFRRRGIAGRSLALISEWGLGTAGLARLELYVDPRNVGPGGRRSRSVTSVRDCCAAGGRSATSAGTCTCIRCWRPHENSHADQIVAVGRSPSGDGATRFL